MVRTLVLVLGLALLVAAPACGGDDDTTPGPGGPTATAHANGNEGNGGDAGADGGAEPTATPTRTVATPTPIPFTGTAIIVASRLEQFAPTLEEFKQLPATELTLPGGRAISGVTIETLAARIDIGQAAVVTIEGYAPGFGAKRFVRRPIEEIASQTVVYETASGHLALASTVLPEEEWLEAIVSVAFE